MGAMFYAVASPSTGKGVRHVSLAIAPWFPVPGSGVLRAWHLFPCGSLVRGGVAMNRLQILYLRRLHGLTEAQANALAALIWGVGQ